MPKDRTNKISCHNYSSEVEITLEVISGKWKALILSHLNNNGAIRYNEFRKIIPGITQKMLSQQLKDLVEDRLVFRTEYPQIPPMVEYRLTDIGTSLIPILQAMDVWGKNYIKRINFSDRQSDD